MDPARFLLLAEELAQKHPGLAQRLREVREAARLLRDQAAAALEAFRERACERGAAYLGHVEISAIEPDEKHIDRVQFTISRGRLELLCSASADGSGQARVVGPYKRGNQEGPCANAPLPGTELEKLLEARLIALLREAAGA